MLYVARVRSVSFYTRFLVTVLVPPAVLLLICLCCLGPLAVLDRMDMSDDATQRRRRQRWRRNTLRILLFTVCADSRLDESSSALLPRC